LKSNPISVSHPHAATSDILVLFAALFIRIVALPEEADKSGGILLQIAAV
jgi:hypothetical protein